MSLLKKAAKLISGKNEGGNQVGFVSVLKDNVGKISFKRSYAIVLLTVVVSPDIAANGLRWENIAVIAIGGAVYVLPKLFSKDSE